MIESHAFETRLASDSYTDLNSLNSIRSMGREDKGKALEEISKQFESMLVRMMMQSMRDANKVFAEDSMLASPQGDMYQQMYDDQMALSLSKGKGLGLSDVMVRQLRQRFGMADGEKINVDQTLQRSGISSASNRQAKPAAAANESFPTALKESVRFDGGIDEFVSTLYGMAKTAAEKLNVSPQTLLAQAALETGWGKKINQDASGESSHNLFNIKAGKEWQGESVNISTLEFVDNIPVREKADFRSYQNLEKSFDDYVSFISGNARYQKALQANGDDAYVKELSVAGYATDPAYADKISRIANSDAMKDALKRVEVN